jgi:hypothetical protein
MGKNCAWIQRKIVERKRRTGPVKKNMPLWQWVRRDVGV